MTSSCISLIVISIVFLKLFFVVDYLQYRLPYGHQRVLVYHVHGVVRGVPEVAEARVALRVVVDDVHAGYLAQVVDIEVVIRHFCSIFLGEESFESQAVGGVPDFFTCLPAVRLEKSSW